MKSEVGKLTKNDGDITSLLNKLYSKNKNDNAFNRAIDQDFLSLNMDGMDSTLAMYMNDAYKNRILKQADIHQVSSQLIELKEALHYDEILAKETRPMEIFMVSVTKKIGYSKALEWISTHLPDDQ